MLGLLVALPLVAAVGLVALPRRGRWLWGYATLITAVEFLLSLQLLQAPPDLWSFRISWPWIPQIGAQFHLATDGLSTALILLTTLLTFLGVVSSYTAITHHIRAYLAALLILEGLMIGVFVAQDLLLFFLFWELQLLPMFLLIGIWGHERRRYAAFKFLLYTMAGSVFLLAGILYLGLKFHTFSYLDLLKEAPRLPFEVQAWLFWAFTLAFAIKVPVWPFHTWLPDAHVEAPTAGSVILAGILLKMGTYGMLRFSLLLFPEAAAQYAGTWMVLGVVGILYGAWMSWVQKDMKRLIAYSSVAHMGFIMLGIFSLTLYGLQGGMLQMLNHGITTGALFFAVGMLYERRHSRLMEAFGGVAREMPTFALLLGISVFASIGLPGLNGFVGEFLALFGGFQVRPELTALAVLGVVFAAVYLLHMTRQVLFLTPHTPRAPLPDLSIREVLVFLPLILLMFWIGVYPRPFLRLTEPFAQQVVQTLGPLRIAPPVEPVHEAPDAPAHLPEKREVPADNEEVQE